MYNPIPISDHDLGPEKGFSVLTLNRHRIIHRFHGKHQNACEMFHTEPIRVNVRAGTLVTSMLGEWS